MENWVDDLEYWYDFQMLRTLVCSIDPSLNIWHDFQTFPFLASAQLLAICVFAHLLIIQNQPLLYQLYYRSYTLLLKLKPSQFQARTNGGSQNGLSFRNGTITSFQRSFWGSNYCRCIAGNHLGLAWVKITIETTVYCEMGWGPYSLRRRYSDGDDGENCHDNQDDGDAWWWRWWWW